MYQTASIRASGAQAPAAPATAVDLTSDKVSVRSSSTSSVTIARALIAKKKELIKLELEELELEQRESDRASLSSHGRWQNSNSNQTVATEVGAAVFKSFSTESVLTGFNVRRLQKSLASVQEDGGAAQAAARPPSVSVP
jgi:hypothetical protein